MAIRPGAEASRPAVLVGAHYDTVRGSPGADDNASGVAGLLEVAHLLRTQALGAVVELVAFSHEEMQGYTYRVGSRRYAAERAQAGARYAGAFILEMIGYVSPDRGAQLSPLLLFWKRLPPAATFIAAIGDWGSGHLLRDFQAAARTATPALPVVTFRSPARGWLVPHTRLSDNASFWDHGYPALMITDTAFLRNPHYHRATDRAATLDYGFMAQVVDAVVEAVVRLGSVQSLGQ